MNATKPAQFTPGTCQCRWSGAVNFVMCPLHTAALAMYEALKGLLNDPYLSDPINADRMADARAAIAKAEGK